jgi:poly(3-hydroxybutyrate) depolymerase
MVLMGGPIDTRVSPTKINEFAQRYPLEAIKQMVVTRVPPPFKGMMRPVYPGFLQLSGFVSMNLGRHFRAHMDMFQNLVKGDGESAATTKRFYKEYLTVMDMPAEFYLETLRAVFQEYHLPTGQFRYRDRLVEPEAIFRTALMTVEGAEDDICGAGQTQAAHDLCAGIPAENRVDYVQQGVGHYGVFNGRKFREQIMPRIADFIARNNG